MRFITLVLTLLSISVVFGMTDDERENRDICLKKIEKYKPCRDFLVGLSESNIDSRCQGFHNYDCYNIYAFTPIPECRTTLYTYNYTPEFFINHLDKAMVIQMLCSKNYDGSYCESNKLYLNNILFTDENEAMEIINKNCVSKKCTSVLTQYLEHLEWNDDIDSDTKAMAKEYLNYIKSDKCTSKFDLEVTERCGPGYGRCLEGCCSKYGFCGDSKSHCEDGCVMEFSRYCELPYSTSTVPGRCGYEFGICPNPGDCCSKYGYCGTTDSHCYDDCQDLFGVCKGGKVNSDVSRSDRCGPGKGSCPGPNDCCSQYGFCGTTENHCGTGCQSRYGNCNDSPITTIPVSTVSGRCGPEYGKCAKNNQCCSKHNYCGTTVDHCSTGCQPQYGICN